MKLNIERLNCLRIEQCLSITKLAEKAIISKATISRILNNQVTARPDTIGKIANALNVPAKELFLEDKYH